MTHTPVRRQTHRPEPAASRAVAPHGVGRVAGRRGAGRRLGLRARRHGVLVEGAQVVVFE
ncbi:hypothetical protein [Kribbella endophytica]